jgi:hypothetical protein
MTRSISLAVNGQPVDIDYFVQGFIDHTVSGMVAALEGTGDVRDLKVSIEKDETMIDLNGTSVPVRPFVGELVKNTVIGIVRSLKGVTEPVRIVISIEK